MDFTFNAFYTLIAAVIVLLLGRFLVNKIDFLKRYNIPEPVAGGLVAAIISLIIHSLWGYSITTSAELQTSFMLIFFAPIWLSSAIWVRVTPSNPAFSYSPDTRIMIAVHEHTTKVSTNTPQHLY
jgi:sodium--glutamate symport carrier gltS